jgi:4-diphosphocytidyl-2-C-methyl-D-erythritol kinase
MDRTERHPAAKINLTLHIMGVRPDGFHELDTVFARTSLCDRMEVRRTAHGGIRLDCPGSDLPTGPDNLVVRAAELFRQRAAIADAFDIRLEKHIPAGGGLGGGSSDAASTLDALNELCGRPLAPADLLGLAAQLGSDVAFFLGPAVARGTGRGEILSPVDAAGLPERALLVNPGFGVPTPWAYAAYRALPPDNKRGEVNATFPWGEMRNDLEPPVFEKYLLLPRLKAWLRDRPETTAAMMSGSGATMLAPGADARALQLDLGSTFGHACWSREVRLG